MDDVKRIEKLLEAGFTADEIRKMFTDDKPASAGTSVDPPGDEPEASGKGAPPLASDEAQEEAESAPNLSDANNAMMAELATWLKDIKEDLNKQIGEMRQTAQEYNRLMARNKEETSSGSLDALASLTNPPGAFPGVKEGE